MILLLRSLITLVLGLTPIALTAQSDGLLDRSPFLPPGFGVQGKAPEQRASPEAQKNYEFRGVFSINDDVRVLVKAKEESEGKWIRVDDPTSTPHIISFNPKEKSLILEHNGTELRLDLVELSANSVPIPVAGQSTAPRPPNIQNPAVNNTNRTSIRRRVVPPRRPQWMEDRIRERNQNSTGQTREPGQPPMEAPSIPEGGFPENIPPPPTMTPETPPELLQAPPNAPPNF